MQGSHIILIFAPIVILVILAPAFEASTFPNIVKGGVIGLYLSLSIIGIGQVIESLKS